MIANGMQCNADAFLEEISGCCWCLSMLRLRFIEWGVLQQQPMVGHLIQVRIRITNYDVHMHNPVWGLAEILVGRLRTVVKLMCAVPVLCGSARAGWVSK